MVPPRRLRTRHNEPVSEIRTAIGSGIDRSGRTIHATSDAGAGVGEESSTDDDGDIPVDESDIDINSGTHAAVGSGDYVGAVSMMANELDFRKNGPYAPANVVADKSGNMINEMPGVGAGVNATTDVEDTSVGPSVDLASVKAGNISIVGEDVGSAGYDVVGPAT